MNLETKRLVIRHFSQKDIIDFHDYLSRETVVRFEPYPPLTWEEVQEELAHRVVNPDFYAVQLRTGKLIGNLYLSKGDFDTWELGYVFNDDYWHQGYAYESVKALLSRVFKEKRARRITAFVNPLNLSSCRLLERLGFRREGTLIENIFFFRDENGEPIWQNTYEYGMLQREWQE